MEVKSDSLTEFVWPLIIFGVFRGRKRKNWLRNLNMNKEYLVISYYPAPYEGSPDQTVAFCDTLESARADKVRIDNCHTHELEELKPIVKIYEVVEIK